MPKVVCIAISDALSFNFHSRFETQKAKMLRKVNVQQAVVKLVSDFSIIICQ